MRIYRTYGQEAIPTIKANPYRLADEIRGIGFKTADELAAKLGIDRNSPHRARAAVRYTLGQVAEEGHCGHPEPGVIKRTAEPVEIDRNVVESAVEESMKDRGSRLTSEIGQAAGVVVSTDPKTGKVKYASAYDLRRSFGERWAARIMPPDLMVLMRHESIETTLKYYVGQNAQNTARNLWRAYETAAASNIPGNTAGNGRNSVVRAGDSTLVTETSYEVGPEGFEPPTKGL